MDIAKNRWKRWGQKANLVSKCSLKLQVFLHVSISNISLLNVFQNPLFTKVFGVPTEIFSCFFRCSARFLCLKARESSVFVFQTIFCSVFAQKLVVNNCTSQTQSESRNFLRPNEANFEALSKSAPLTLRKFSEQRDFGKKI